MRSGLFLIASCATTALASAIVSHRETLNEAAVHVRELIAYRSFGMGVLMSKYDENAGELANRPVGLQEYYARYPDDSGDLLLLAMPISTVFRNALPPNNGEMTMTISDYYGMGKGNLAAGRMRIALYGNLEAVEESEVEKCQTAYLQEHPDARGWTNNGPHFAFFARLRITKVFAFDGFGNVAYIGWVPLDLYKSSGKSMRSKKQVHRKWPIPIQPEEGLAIEQLFAEGGEEIAEGEEKVGELIVQQ